VFQKGYGAFYVAEEAKQGKHQQRKYGQSDKLGHTGDHKGEIAAEEHIVIHEAQQPVNDLAIENVDQAAADHPTQILKTGAVFAGDVLQSRDQQKAGVLQHTFEDGENKNIVAENAVWHGKGQDPANESEKIEHLLAGFPVQQRKDRQQDTPKIARIHGPQPLDGITLDEVVDQPPTDFEDQLKDRYSHEDGAVCLLVPAQYEGSAENQHRSQRYRCQGPPVDGGVHVVARGSHIADQPVFEHEKHLAF